MSNTEPIVKRHAKNPILTKDDVLVYYTDGVTEAWNEAEEDYGDERFVQTITKWRKASAEDIMQAIENDIRNHVGNAPQSDDIACVVIKRI